jgi:hypothetical protein
LILVNSSVWNGYELLHNGKDFDPFVKYLGLREVD